MAFWRGLWFWWRAKNEAETLFRFGNRRGIGMMLRPFALQQRAKLGALCGRIESAFGDDEAALRRIQHEKMRVGFDDFVDGQPENRVAAFVVRPRNAFVIGLNGDGCSGIGVLFGFTPGHSEEKGEQKRKHQRRHCIRSDFSPTWTIQTVHQAKAGARVGHQRKRSHDQRYQHGNDQNDPESHLRFDRFFKSRLVSGRKFKRALHRKWAIHKKKGDEMTAKWRFATNGTERESIIL